MNKEGALPAVKNTQNQRLVYRLIGIAVAMFVFAIFVMPPFYDAICALTGLNGKTSGQASSLNQTAAVNQERVVTVEFVADVNPGMPWTFEPRERSIQVHPGEIHQMNFYVKNNSQADLIGQAIPSVAPAQATRFFKKTECFCFREQPLAAGDSRDMPMVFYLDADLPPDIKRITLAYKLFDITASRETVSAESKRQKQGEKT